MMEDVVDLFESERWLPLAGSSELGAFLAAWRAIGDAALDMATTTVLATFNDHDAGKGTGWKIEDRGSRQQGERSFSARKPRNRTEIRLGLSRLALFPYFVYCWSCFGLEQLKVVHLMVF